MRIFFPVLLSFGLLVSILAAIWRAAKKMCLDMLNDAFNDGYRSALDNPKDTSRSEWQQVWWDRGRRLAQLERRRFDEERINRANERWAGQIDPRRLRYPYGIGP